MADIETEFTGEALEELRANAKKDMQVVPYVPSCGSIIVLRPGSQDISLEIPKESITRLADLAALGWVQTHILEAVGLSQSQYSQLQKQAELYSKGLDDGGALNALREVNKAILFGRMQWREWLSRVVKTRIEFDDSPTLAVLAAKQTHGMDWKDRAEGGADGGPLRVEVTHRIINSIGEEISIVATEGEFKDVEK